MRCTKYKHYKRTNYPGYRVRVQLERGRAAVPAEPMPFVWLSSEACVLGVLAVCFLPPPVEYSVRRHLLQYLLCKVVHVTLVIVYKVLHTGYKYSVNKNNSEGVAVGTPE